MSYKKSQSPFFRRKSPKLSKSLSSYATTDDCDSATTAAATALKRRQNKSDSDSFEIMREMNNDRCPLLDFEVSQEFDDDVFIERRRREPNSFEIADHPDDNIADFCRRNKAAIANKSTGYRLSLSSNDDANKDSKTPKVSLSSSADDGDEQRLSPTAESVRSQDSGFSDSGESPKSIGPKTGILKTDETSNNEMSPTIIKLSSTPVGNASSTGLGATPAALCLTPIQRRLVAPPTPISIEIGGTDKYCLTPEETGTDTGRTEEA